MFTCGYLIKLDQFGGRGRGGQTPAAVAEAVFSGQGTFPACLSPSVLCLTDCAHKQTLQSSLTDFLLVSLISPIITGFPILQRENLYLKRFRSPVLPRHYFN